MPSAKNVAIRLISIAIGVLCVGIAGLVAFLGGFLNRGRGGYIHFGPLNASNSEVEDWYWPAHVLSRILFAIPTGLLVLLFGLHGRASLVVTVMTWFSLYVGWGCYMNIGMVDNLASRSGVFDWLLGRQGANWTVSHRFVREYVGMSWCGVVWTAPQGYLLEQLGFGWEYSLSGSLMALVYYMGAHTNISGIHDETFRVFFNRGIAASEVYWGWWMWFILCVVSLSQLVRRGRVCLFKKNPYQGIKPYSTWEVVKYLSLNRSPLRFFYDLFICLFNLILCCSLVFYAIVEQSDVRNKAQTFFGLFTAILALCFSQGWVWNLQFLNWKLKRLKKKVDENQQDPHALSNDSHPHSLWKPLQGQTDTSRKSPNRFNDLGKYEASVAARNGETQLLLSWPYSHPDRISPTGERCNTLILPEGNPSVSCHLHHVFQSTGTSTAFLTVWLSLESWVWLDIFVLVRRLIGLVSLLSVVLTLVLTVVAVVWDFKSPRFVSEPTNIFVLNATLPG